jgi:Tfp pilus assembly major pilin PilA
MMENSSRNQKGLTLVGFLIVLGVILFFAYSAMRVVPMYLEYHALTNAMDKLVQDPTAKGLSPAKIKQNIKMSLWASYASQNIKETDMRISKKDGAVVVRVAYEVRKEFLGNIDIIGSFDRTVELR